MLNLNLENSRPEFDKYQNFKRYHGESRNKAAVNNARAQSNGYENSAWIAQPKDLAPSVRENSMKKWNQDIAKLMPRNNAGYAPTGFMTPDISLLTAMTGEVFRQQFYTVGDLTDYMEIEIGKNPYFTESVVQISRASIGAYKQGFIQGSHLGKVNTNNDDIAKLVFSRHYWAHMIEWTMIEQMQGMVVNYDHLRAKMMNEKLAYDLTIEETLFYGLPGLLGYSQLPIYGLVNNPNITPDTTSATKPLSEMTAAELIAFLSAIINKYMAQTNIYKMPNRMLVPFSVYVSLQSPLSSEFPVGDTRITYVERVLSDMYRVRGGVGEFKILANAYVQADFAKTIEDSNLEKDRIVLYNNSKDVVYFDLPIPFTSLMQDTANGGFSFSHYVFSQIGGNRFIRENNVYYVDLPAPTSSLRTSLQSTSKKVAKEKTYFSVANREAVLKNAKKLGRPKGSKGKAEKVKTDGEQ